MKKSYVYLFAAAIIVCLNACDPTVNHHADSYTDHEGNQARFSDYNGKWLVINYWAIWCKPCIEEIPEFNALAEDMKDKVVVMGVDFDGSMGETLATSIEKLNIKFTVLTQNPAQQLGFKEPQVLPATYIFNPQGSLHTTLLGPQTLESLKEAINP